MNGIPSNAQAARRRPGAGRPRAWCVAVLTLLTLLTVGLTGCGEPDDGGGGGGGGYVTAQPTG